MLDKHSTNYHTYDPMQPAPFSFLSAVFRILGSLLSPAGAKARLSILIYHRVLPETDSIFPNESTVTSFDQDMATLKSVFNVLPLPEAVARLKAGTLPARAACITFDDGYADNFTNALPILQKHSLTATFFIATAYLNGGRMFNDTIIEAIRRCDTGEIDLTSLGLDKYDVSTPQAKRLAIGAILPQVKYLPPAQREETVAELARRATDVALPDDLMMTTKQLKALHAAGMEIGGHTDHHPILARLNDTEAKAEIAIGKTRLEAILGFPVRLFAYPNGKPGTDYRPEQATIVRELGFEAAVSTQHGTSSQATDPYQLARFTPWDTKSSAFAMRLLRNLLSRP